MNMLLLASVLISLLFQVVVDAFQPDGIRTNKSATTGATVMAWSLQTPEVSFMKSTWYDDVKSPTFRRLKYDDDSTEFRLSTIGSSWPEYEAAAEKEATAAAASATKATPSRPFRLKPLQRVRNLLNYRRH